MQPIRDFVANLLRRVGGPVQLFYPAAVLYLCLVAGLGTLDRAGLLVNFNQALIRYRIPLPLLVGGVFVATWGSLVFAHYYWRWGQHAPWIEDAAEGRGGLVWWDTALIGLTIALMLLTIHLVGFLTFDLILVGGVTILAALSGITRAWTTYERFYIVRRLIYLDIMEDVADDHIAERTLEEPSETFDEIAQRLQQAGVITSPEQLLEWNHHLQRRHAPPPPRLIAGDELRLPRRGRAG